MNTPSSSPSTTPIAPLTSETAHSRFWLNWWYLLSCPAEPDPRTPFAVRSAFWRARTTSQIMLVMIGLILVSLIAGLKGTNPLLFPALLVDLFLQLIAVLLNRMGYRAAAGILTVCIYEASVAGNVLSTPGGISLTAVPIFDLLVMPLVLAAALLPRAEWVFVVALLNILFTFLGFTVLPHAHDFALALRDNYGAIFTLPVNLQVVVAAVTVIYVKRTNEALRAADRSEQIALLEQAIVQQQQREVEQAQLLARDIEAVTSALTQIANGHLKASIPVSEKTLLWGVVGQLNNQFRRYEQARTDQILLEKTRQAISELVQAMERAGSQHPLDLSARTGTPLDAVLLELLRVGTLTIRPTHAEQRDAGWIGSFARSHSQGD